jgi:hypothetical protein
MFSFKSKHFYLKLKRMIKKLYSIMMKTKTKSANNTDSLSLSWVLFADFVLIGKNHFLKTNQKLWKSHSKV